MKEQVKMTTMSRRRMQRLHLLAVITVAILYSHQGWAFDGCSRKTTSITIDVGKVIIQKDTSNLAVLTPVINSAASGYDCQTEAGSTSVGVKSYGTDTGEKAGIGKVYASNVSGIGFIIGATATGGYSFWVGYTQSGWSGVNWVLTRGSQSGYIDYSTTAKIRLYKTGDLKSGTLSGQIGAFIVGNGQSPTAWGTEIPIYITGTVTTLACSLSSTSINVPLGDTLVSKFTGVGISTGDKAFNVGLTCDKDAKINVSLDGTQNTDTTETSVLALTSAGQTGTASGVGVQLLYGGTPLKINNNILLKTSAGGKETLPFTARYYQTKAAVGSGQANSSATLNITYQ
ncbi:fimbrial protein [Serratia proteamaculans]|uniref:fimbrial protein n=1 Tax=Serratia proteamaculans TaxID=28151 RepID=UPI001C577F68|nr:fimbrial protein [Serratia proteamaculans]WEO87657.1 fimbrial protein [Serratia proteamaculans]